MSYEIYETIELFDGEKNVEAKLIASFSLDDKNYCCLELDDERFLAEYYEEGDDMVFQTIEDDEEFEEVAMALEELLAEQEADEDEQGDK